MDLVHWLGRQETVPPPEAWRLLMRAVNRCDATMVQDLAHVYKIDITVLHLPFDVPFRSSSDLDREEHIVESLGPPVEYPDEDLDDIPSEHSDDASSPGLNRGDYAPFEDSDDIPSIGSPAEESDDASSPGLNRGDYDPFEDGEPLPTYPLTRPELGVNRVYSAMIYNPDKTRYELSYFILKEISLTGNEHKIQWLYTPSQLPFDVPDDWVSKTDAIQRSNAIPLFLSNEHQPLGYIGTWHSIYDKVHWGPVYYAHTIVTDDIYVLASFDDGEIDENDRTMENWMIDGLLSRCRDGGKHLKKIMRTSDVHLLQTLPPGTDGRCSMCNKSSSLVLRCALWKDGDQSFRFGPTCAKKFKAVFELIFNTNIDWEIRMENARKALVL
jgi:hypothetical protein